MLRCTTDKQDGLLQEAREFKDEKYAECPECHEHFHHDSGSQVLVDSLIELAEDLAKQLDDANDRLEAIAKKCEEASP